MKAAGDFFAFHIDCFFALSGPRAKLENFDGIEFVFFQGCCKGN